MSRNKKANIAPEFVGHYYTDGDAVWRLEACGSEPIARLKHVETERMEELPVSQFKDFVRLEPVSPIPEVKKPRKERKDTGGTHAKKTIERADPKSKRAPTFEREGQASTPEKTLQFDITKWHLKTPQGDEQYESVYGEIAGVGSSYLDATKDLFAKLSLPTEGEALNEFLSTIPDDQELKTLLSNILTQE